MTDSDRAEWHLDRRFTLALILVIVGQIGTGVWFAAKMDSRLYAVEQGFLQLAQTVESNRSFQVEQRVRVWDQVRAQGETVNNLKAELAGMNARLDYMVRAIDRLMLLNDQRARDYEREREKQ